MKRTLIAAACLVLVSAPFAVAQQAPPPAGSTPTQTGVGPNFVDADGDGICDLQGTRAGQRRGRGMGPGDGTGHQGNGPRDGSGFGAMNGGGQGRNCTGTCTGQGPQGRGMGRRGARG